MAITITAATWATGQATFTTSAAHGITPGTQVQISGITPAGYNGTFTALAGTTGSTIVVAIPTNPGTYSSGGSVATDPFSAYPAIVMGRIGVAKDGSVWATAKNAMTMVAPAGTVSPLMMETLGFPSDEPQEALYDEDEPRSRRRR